MTARKPEKRPDNWMPLYVGDYLRDTSRLTTEQHGAYLLLIMDCWVNGPLPDDDEVLAAIVKATPSMWRKLRPIMVGFFDVVGGQWIHGRVEKERMKATDNIEKRSRAGKSGARSRWHSDDNRNSERNADANDNRNGDRIVEPMANAPKSHPKKGEKGWQNDGPLPPPQKDSLQGSKNSEDHSLGLGDEPPADPAAVGGKPRVIAGGKP